ncbi:MAG: rhomboid family intramembrane serine protease [Archaeoglobaceae archaeon]
MEFDISRRKRIFPYGANNTVLFVCLVLFLFGTLFPMQAVYFLALNPIRILEMPWQLVTSIFLHIELWHFFINSFVLLFFGSELERLLGEKGYLKVFFLSGLAGNVGYIAYAYALGSFAPALGASGAIFGVMGSLAMIAPRTKIIIFPIPFPINIRLAILFFAFYDFGMLVLSASHLVYSGVAYIAHLTGLIAGLYLGEGYKAKIYA